MNSETTHEHGEQQLERVMRIDSLDDLKACMAAADRYLARLPISEDAFDPEATLRGDIRVYFILVYTLEAVMKENGDTRRHDVEKVVAELPW